MSRRITGDVSGLPDAAFGARTVLWWGVLGFMLIEGGAFALACGAYLFLMSHSDPWPPRGYPPGLAAGLVFTAIALLSEIPNVWTNRMAHAEREGPMKVGLVIMSVIGIALVAVRWVEFRTLNVRWDANAYGSIVWALMILHTTHVITDLADTIGVTVFSFTHAVDTNRCSDVADNCLYWHFVVLAWLPIYALVYWAPRLAG
jgi:cytochrome c oxidase subunit 3